MELKNFGSYSRRFAPGGVVYRERDNLLLLIASYGSTFDTRFNTLWRFDFESKRWKRLKDLNLPYPLGDVVCGLTKGDKYMVVLGREVLSVRVKVLILDLEEMKWINVETELDVADHGKLSMVILRDNNIHIFFSGWNNKSHYSEIL